MLYMIPSLYTSFLCSSANALECLVLDLLLSLENSLFIHLAGAHLLSSLWGGLPLPPTPDRLLLFCVAWRGACHILFGRVVLVSPPGLQVPNFPKSWNQCLFTPAPQHHRQCLGEVGTRHVYKFVHAFVHLLSQSRNLRITSYFPVLSPPLILPV